MADWIVSDIQPFHIAGLIAPHLAIPKAPLPNRLILFFWPASRHASLPRANPTVQTVRCDVTVADQKMNMVWQDHVTADRKIIVMFAMPGCGGCFRSRNIITTLIYVIIYRIGAQSFSQWVQKAATFDN